MPDIARRADAGFPASREIDERFVEKALPVIHQPLTTAGVRLAGVLNCVLAGP